MPSAPLLRRQVYGHDDPPATSESSTPQTRRSRLRQALQSTSDLAHGTRLASEEMARRMQLPPIPDGADRRVYERTAGRRRRRSESADQQDEPRATSSVGEARRPRYKRRRLDPSPPLETRKPIKYGYYGQVEPGRLKLELVSCDGGEHHDHSSPSASLGPHNVLIHNKSVYCSERSYANIVLRHADDTPFCLATLFVIGPEHGFTAPVREGEIHIAMTLSDLQKYIDADRPPHAQLSPLNPRSQSRRRTSPERLTLSDALRDPAVNAAFDDREYSYHLEADLPQEAQCPLPTEPALDNENRHVTYLTEDSPGPEETSSQEVLDYRLQRLRLTRRRIEAEAWDREERWAGLNRLPREEISRTEALNALMARSRVSVNDTVSPEPISAGSTAAAAPAPAPITSSSSRAWPADPNVTSARFSIEKGKYKVAVKFSPPVSGRFILLKVWAGAPPVGMRERTHQNVDVQSVIATGFGGGRFFPAAVPR